MGTHAELYDLLPHRHPILLVDRIVDAEPGAWIETVKTVSGSEPCYAGLAGDASPEAFGYPRVLVLESFVQSAAALWARTARTEGGALDGTLVFGGASGLEFHCGVGPGDTLRHRVRIANRVGSNAFFTGETTVSETGETVLTVGSIALASRPDTVFRRLLGSAGPLGPTGPVRR